MYFVSKGVTSDTEHWYHIRLLNMYFKNCLFSEMLLPHFTPKLRLKVGMFGPKGLSALVIIFFQLPSTNTCCDGKSESALPKFLGSI